MMAMCDGGRVLLVGSILESVLVITSCLPGKQWEENVEERRKRIEREIYPDVEGRAVSD